MAHWGAAQAVREAEELRLHALDRPSAKASRLARITLQMPRVVLSHKSPAWSSRMPAMLSLSSPSGMLQR